MSGLFPSHNDEPNDERESHAELAQRFFESLALRFPFGRRRQQADGSVCFSVRNRSITYAPVPPIKPGTESNQFVIHFFEDDTATGEMVPGMRVDAGLAVATPRSMLFLSRATELAAEHGGMIGNHEETDTDEPGMLMHVLSFADSCSATRRFEEKNFRVTLGPMNHH